jgi:hypothetical protein
MDKKWSCPACEYKSGRRSNIERHIDRKHGGYGVPALTQSQQVGLNHQASSWYHRGHYFPHTSHEGFTKGALEKKEESFISSYKFEDKKLGIYKKFRDATKLSPSEDRDLIVKDLMLQMQRASSNPNQFWLDALKIMTPAMITYPSRSDSAPTWWPEISKLKESKNFNNSETTTKSASAVKANVSTDSHKRKLEVALQKFLNYKKEREIFEHRTQEFGDNANIRKTDKSNPN